MERVQLNIRVDPEVRQGLRILSAVSRTSEQELAERAIRGLLAAEGHRVVFDAAVEEVERQYLPALEALADL